MQVRVLHVNSEDPWVRSNILIDYFGVTNPAVKTVKRFGIQNALSLIENIGWVVGKLIEHKTGISVLFIKNEIENE